MVDSVGNTPAQRPSSSSQRPPTGAILEEDGIDTKVYSSDAWTGHASAVGYIHDQFDGNNRLLGYTVPDSGNKKDYAIPTIDDINQHIDTFSSEPLLRVASGVREIVAQGETDEINISIGMSLNALVINEQIDLNNVLQKDPKKAQDILQAMDRTCKPETLIRMQNGRVTGLEQEKIRDIILNYVNARIQEPGSAFQQALATWDQTKEYANRHNVGITIAAGNKILRPNSKVSNPDGDIELLGYGKFQENVTLVGACDETGRFPKDLAAEGNEQVHPTVCALGVRVPIDSKGTTGSGSSASAPLANATKVRMLEVNPNLTPSERKEILIQTAGNWLQRHFPETAANNMDPDFGNPNLVGRGKINPDLAVEEAKARKKTP